MYVFKKYKAAFGVTVVLISAVCASAQMRRSVPADPSTPIGIEKALPHAKSPEDATVANLQQSQVLGRVTDFRGRSIRGARITLYCLDTDSVYRATSNPFGYYRFQGLTEGHRFLVSIDHNRYLFLSGSISITLFAEPVEIDFQAERLR